MDRNIGPYQYTFTNVPYNHPMAVTSHGSGAYGCVPAIVSATYTTAYHHYGTVVVDFSGCTHQQSSEFQCGYHGRMNGGTPWLTVNSAC